MTTQAATPELQYPIGKPPIPPAPLSDAERKQAICDIEALPSLLRKAVANLSPEQLDTPYRPGGWTVRQVVHHLADAHMNAFARFKLALTENEPTVKSFNEKAWADLPEARTAALEPSLAILDGIHRRWGLLLSEMQPADFARTFRHPERGVLTLEANTALYAWHSKHHLAHITSLRERMGW